MIGNDRRFEVRKFGARSRSLARIMMIVLRALLLQEVPALAVAATALVGARALVDFSFQSSAVAIAFAAIPGIG